MPGAVLVSNASSVLLSPLPPGSVFLSQPPPRAASELGVCFRSVFQISRLAWPSTADLDALVASPSDAERADRLAVQRFSARLQVLVHHSCTLFSFLFTLFLSLTSFFRLQVWAREMPVFSSPEVVGRGELAFDLTSGTSAVDAAISSQLAIVRDVLFVDRASRFDEVRL